MTITATLTDRLAERRGTRTAGKSEPGGYRPLTTPPAIPSLSETHADVQDILTEIEIDDVYVGDCGFADCSHDHCAVLMPADTVYAHVITISDLIALRKENIFFDRCDFEEAITARAKHVKNLRDRDREERKLEAYGIPHQKQAQAAIAERLTELDTLIHNFEHGSPWMPGNLLTEACDDEMLYLSERPKNGTYRVRVKQMPDRAPQTEDMWADTQYLLVQNLTMNLNVDLGDFTETDAKLIEDRITQHVANIMNVGHIEFDTTRMYLTHTTTVDGIPTKTTVETALKQQNITVATLHRHGIGDRELFTNDFWEMVVAGITV